MASDVKQRMIEQMVRLLATKGLQGSSFSEVLEASGAPRGSLYHHFPGGKDELVIAALDLAAGRAFAHIDSMRGRPAVEVARGFIGAWRGMLEQTSLQASCAVMAVTVSADSQDLRMRTGQIFCAWRDRLTDALREGDVGGERARAMAATLIAACEGAVGMARAEGSLAAFELVAREQIAAFEAATSRKGPRTPKAAK